MHVRPRLALLESGTRLADGIAEDAAHEHGPKGPPHRLLRTEREEATRSLPVTAARFVTVELFSAMTGLSPGAVHKRIERGVYLEGKQLRRAPDGRIWMDTKGHEQWVARETA